MAKTNVPVKKESIFTHEGAKAAHISPIAELRRSVMACMLWEDSFYEDGVSIADRIKTLAGQVPMQELSITAVEARSVMHLRHVPLLLARELARQHSTHKYQSRDTQAMMASIVEHTIAGVIQRADELAEFVSIYQLDGRKPLSAAVKRGLARAFHRFDEYQLAKYNRDGKVKLSDVLRLVHPRPVDKEQAELWGRLRKGTLATPWTWEVALSAGGDKRDVFTRLIEEGKLGGLALLRNLRNMEQAGVDNKLIIHAIRANKFSRVLPFRFIAAQKYAPNLSAHLEEAMLRSVKEMPKLPGRTVLLVDVSGSMIGTKVSAKSEIDRLEAASALGILVRELCEDGVVIAFSDTPKIIPAHFRGFSLAEKIRSVAHGGTYTGKAIEKANALGYDRIIVVTDEQSHDSIPSPLANSRPYFINVAMYKNGIGYGKWTHIDGWSEGVLRYIQASEGCMLTPEGTEGE